MSVVWSHWLNFFYHESWLITSDSERIINRHLYLTSLFLVDSPSARFEMDSDSCKGGDDCCNQYNPCLFGQGDCDEDHDCRYRCKRKAANNSACEVSSGFADVRFCTCDYVCVGAWSLSPVCEFRNTLIYRIGNRLTFTLEIIMTIFNFPDLDLSVEKETVGTCGIEKIGPWKYS